MPNTPPDSNLMTTASAPLFGGLKPHIDRDRAVNEVHARPFHPLKAPMRVLHFAFLTDDAAKKADKKWFRENLLHSADTPEGAENPRRVERAGVVIRWEPHSEFTTYTLEQSLNDNKIDFSSQSALELFAKAGLRQPGPLLVALDMNVIRADDFSPEFEAYFDRPSLAVSQVEAGRAAMATDFYQHQDGRIRILLCNGSLNKWQLGPLVQRVLEFETYRTLALLGLIEAHKISPQVRDIENELARLSQEMRNANQLEQNRALLDALTRLAADLEAQAVASSYRFGATRAYAKITEMRLETIGETSLEGYSSWGGFMSRRLTPAMRTCHAITDRQADLSRKLTRAANLLRTRVDVEIERQNRDLLSSMNERSSLQLRLQQTVEGLSVAAISYYIVGLVGYVAKALKEIGIKIEPFVITGASVPIVLGIAWVILARIRRAHMNSGKPSDEDLPI